MTRTRTAAALLAVAALGLAACGGDSDSDSDEGGLSADAGGGARTIEVDMADNEFRPARVEVAAGEPVRFVFSNEGEATHDAVVGDEATQAAHEDEMRSAEPGDAGMAHGSDDTSGDEAAAITVEPGDTGELTHTFAAGDEVLVGCHEPGHYDAGMRLTVDVTAP